MKNVKDCVFCKIVEGEIDSEKVYESEDVISFLDVNPRAPGHTLVIPKKHVNSIIELEDHLIADLFCVAKTIMRVLRSTLDPDGFTVGLNEGRAAGQEIPHLHVNIIPRFEGDGGSSIHSVVDNTPDEEVSEIAGMMRETSRDL